MEPGDQAVDAPARGIPEGRLASYLLSVLGVVMLLGAAAYASHAILHTWLVTQDRYLLSRSTASLVLMDSDPAAGQTSIQMPEEVRPLPAGDTAAPGGAKASEVTSPVDDNSVGSGSPTAGPSQAQAAPLPQPAMTTTSQPSAQPTPDPTAAVRIRIPAIGVDRAIIEVPLTHDTRTGTWERDYSLLFRRPGKDLVGHWVGSASPGQPGNTILVGHNYGYGYNGVFVRLERLKRGQRVEVVNASGQVYTYRVTEVKSIRWKAKNQEELLQHLPYLSVDGPERLTLVTCGGSEWAPFPKRVYVVAEPGP